MADTENTATSRLPPTSEKPAATADGQLSLDIRMCRACSTTLFSHRDFAAAATAKPADQRTYETLRQFERGIRQLLPSFHRALHALQPPDAAAAATARPTPPPTHAQIQDAAKLRRRLTDAFAKYDAAARRVRDLPAESEAQRRLQRAVHAQASAFLHANLIPLKSLPKLLRGAEGGGGGGSSSGRAGSNGHDRMGSTGAASPLRNGEVLGNGEGGEVAEEGTETGSEASAVATLEAEERALRERLVVLEEQRFLVLGMMGSARGARRFEEVGALRRNVEELDGEIEALQKKVGSLEERLEGLYSGTAGGS